MAPRALLDEGLSTCAAGSLGRSRRRRRRRAPPPRPWRLPSRRRPPFGGARCDGGAARAGAGAVAREKAAARGAKAALVKKVEAGTRCWNRTGALKASARMTKPPTPAKKAAATPPRPSPQYRRSPATPPSSHYDELAEAAAAELAAAELALTPRKSPAAAVVEAGADLGVRRGGGGGGARVYRRPGRREPGGLARRMEVMEWATRPRTSWETVGRRAEGWAVFLT